MKLDIWDEMMALERRFDDLARAFLGPHSRLSFPMLPSGFRRPFIPATDIIAKNGDMVIKLDLPGIDPKKDVTVTVEDDELVIRGKRKQKDETREGDYYRMEASYGAFERHFPLFEKIEDKDVKAEYKKGVLEVTVPAPKAVSATKAKEIPIQVEKSEAV